MAYEPVKHWGTHGLAMRAHGRTSLEPILSSINGNDPRRRDGAPGSNGSSGRRGTQGRQGMSHGSNGGNGGRGEDGSRGKNGGDGQSSDDIRVVLRGSPEQLVISSQKDGERTFAMGGKDSKGFILLDAKGGDGGRGGRGGDGGRGGEGGRGSEFLSLVY